MSVNLTIFLISCSFISASGLSMYVGMLKDNAVLLIVGLALLAVAGGGLMLVA